MKRYILAITMMVVSLASFADEVDEHKVTGKLVDRDTKEEVIQATVQLLKQDSTYVTGAISNEKGEFIIPITTEGKYIIKISSIGYSTFTKNIVLEKDKDLPMGNITLGADAIMLKETTVTGRAVKVVVNKDTFVYNASAYRTPEGSVLEELVKRLPGAQIDDNGKITINGKEVKKILVDGKEFMTGDTKTAMKNLPTSIVEKVKAYDQKSDLTRITGIDDGNEQTVLDFGLKKGMNKGFFSNVDLSIGTKDRYSEKLMGAYFNSKYRVMLFGSANNVNDMGFGGRGGGFGRGRNGLTDAKMFGANFNYEEKDKLIVDGSVMWNHTDGDTHTKSSSENFVSTVGSFSNSVSQAYSRGNSWNGQMRLEWKPDTMTNIMFRPNISYSTSDSRNISKSASFNEDPYLTVDDPLSTDGLTKMAANGAVVNSHNNTSISYSEQKRFGGTLQYNRKFGNKGRNITLRADASYSENNNNSISTNNVHLYQIKDIFGADSTYQTNRYNVTPTKNYSYSLQTTYSEPIWKATFLQFSYKFTYSRNKSDRATYDFSNLGENFFSGVTPSYRGWDRYLSLLGQPYQNYLDNSLSRYSEYKNYNQEIQVMLRILRTKYTFNAGLMLKPQRSHFLQEYQNVHTDTIRNVVNFTPTLDFRYNFSDISNLRVQYNGSTSQPSITDLLDITDDSNPLNITKGNPGLKPSFTNTLRAYYNTYLRSHQRAIMANLNYSTTSNSISSMVTYDDKTGGRTTRPENINGNWNVSGAFMFNTSIDSVGVWNVNTFTNLNYNNYVGYVSLNSASNSQKNTTRSMNVSERLAASYRNDWLEVEADGSLNYTHSRNKLQSASDLDTWQFSYGLNVNINAPWGTSLSTDIHENSRRGYNEQSMNTNELIWNAQISQSFLKGKPLTVMLQFYDILNNQSNFSRTINALQRSDTEYNSINSYAMLHVIYRFNAFGGKDARREMRRGPGNFNGNRPQGDRRGNRGGFGGQRPRGGFGGGFGGPR